MKSKAQILLAYIHKSRRIHTCAKSSGKCVGCTVTAESWPMPMRKQLKQVVSSRVNCNHFVRSLRDCVTDACTGRKHRFTLRCVPLKWHALTRLIARHCGNKIRASVSAALDVDHVVINQPVPPRYMTHTSLTVEEGTVRPVSDSNIPGRDNGDIHKWRHTF